jgi:hypothetical protein
MSCTHERTSGYWVESEDWSTGRIERDWVETSESAQVDIDLHRYRCSLCGEVGYYSGLARDYYESGEDPTGMFSGD